jgi:hypothetical protein
MRWLVEVTSIGKTEKETFCVEADSWQKALQQARALRSDTGPMSGFSIELLEEGCRAVDPMSRLRYEVKKAPPDMPLSVAPPANSAVASAALRPRSGAFGSSGGGLVQEAIAEARKKKESARPPPGGVSSMGARPASAPRIPPAPAAPSIPIEEAPTVNRMEEAPTVADYSFPPDLDGNLPPAQIIYRREQNPTDATPLTYREYVFAVAHGTSESTAERVLLAQFENVRRSLENAGQGKLVNLAIFDVVFRGKAPVPPLVTLMWKDWRGEPQLTFPRRPGYTPAPIAMPPTVAARPEPPAPAPAPVLPPPPVGAVPAYAPMQPFAQEPHFVPPTAPVPINTPAPAFAAPAFPSPGPLAQTVRQQPIDLVRPTPGRGVKPVHERGRIRGDELIADLFEAMHDLHFVKDAVEGGDFVLTLALEKLPSHAGIVHLYDIDRREFVVTSTRGPGAERLLLQRHGENDPLLSSAMRKRRAIVLADAEASEAAALERFAQLGGAKSIIIAPVMQAGRFLGAIELLNPLDGAPFTDDEGNALTYIGEQFAEFVATRGVVTDPERISNRQGARP